MSTQVNHSEITTCWKHIGVWGDGSCKNLPTYAHCRNCPDYRRAAAALLDREPPPGYYEDWTQRVAQPRQPRLTGTKPVVIFRLGGEWLALPTTSFQEVAELRPVHSLPHRADTIVKGLINIRGELLICISLAALLGLETAPEPAAKKSRSAHQRLLVATHQTGRVVFPVTEVHGSRRYHPDDLKPLPSTVALTTARYSIGLLAWQQHLVGVLDAELLFYTLNRSLS
ncbi:MAG: chemotaxis protein CheW [Verrucomicrobiota bacterium]